MSCNRWLGSSLLAVLLLAGTSPPGRGQSLLNPLAPTGEVAAGKPAEATTVADRRAENAARLRLAQRQLEDAEQEDPDAAQQVAHLKSLDGILAQIEAVDQQIQSLESRKSDLENELQSPPVDDAPTTFIDLDNLRDELDAQRARTKLLASRLATTKAAAERAQSNLDAAKRATRRAKEVAELGHSRENAAELALAAEQAEQAEELAAETLKLRKKEVQRDELSQQVQQLSVQLLERQVDRLSPQVTFSKADLDNRLENIKQQEESLRAALDQVDRQKSTVDRRLAEARRQAEAANGDKPIAAEKVEAWRRAHDKLDIETQLLNQQLLRLQDVATAWKRRYELATWRSAEDAPADGDAASAKPPNDWLAETNEKLRELSNQSRLQISNMVDLRNTMATVDQKIDAAQDGPPELREHLEQQRRYLAETMRLYEANLVSIDSTRRVLERLQSELNQGKLALSPIQWAQVLWDQATTIWNYQLGELDGRNITVARVVTGLIVFIVGWFAARVLSTLFVHRILKRARLSKDASAAIKTLSFYVLLIVAALIALDTVNIPLTAFTILGGAMAIGVGFGSQQLVNNFLSGLIMLAERPVRIGERIVFGAYDGMVEEVGFRSTKLRTLTDHLVTIPNANLVNEPIENIGRRRTIRRLFNVTITYDTPRDKIVEAVQTIRDILEEPGIREPIHPVLGWDKYPPRVYFDDYNAESLNIFVIYWFAPPEYWDYLEHCERVNLRIFEEFERLGVEFAFPSRTLYLAGDPKRELAVKMLGGDSQAAG